jgi:phospholipid-binding lipoprotein MlaA
LLAFFLFTTVNSTVSAEDTPTTSGLIAQSEAGNDNGDPLEPVNRAILGFNEFIQDLFLRPITQLYVLLLPDFAIDGIHNALLNLSTPLILANDLLQWEPERAWKTTQRFFINSTLGLGGLMDPAKDFGIEGHEEDFGQTFAVWGVPEGFYLVLPIFGPSNPRDAVGLVAGSFLDPISHWLNNINREEYVFARTLVSGVDKFSGVMDDLEKLKETSIDYYAALRSIARQKRNAEILNGAPAAGAPLPDLKYDFNAQFTE